MTLKEKFSDVVLVPLSNEGFYLDLDKVEKCEQIADEFAIGFAEWLLNSNHFIKLLSAKELLEIYKKEKGL